MRKAKQINFMSRFYWISLALVLRASCRQFCARVLFRYNKLDRRLRKFVKWRLILRITGQKFELSWYSFSHISVLSLLHRHIFDFSHGWGKIDGDWALGFFTWMERSMAQITSCDLGEINDGLRADCFPALKILAIRLVFVSRAAYTRVKQNPVPNCCTPQMMSFGLENEWKRKKTIKHKKPWSL